MDPNEELNLGYAEIQMDEFEQQEEDREFSEAINESSNTFFASND